MVKVDGQVITFSFGYDVHTIELLKSIPDRAWKPSQRVWTLPATQWHAQKTIELFDGKLTLDRSVYVLAESHNVQDLAVAIQGDGLYPFQATGVGFLLSHKGRGLICDEMGLGKTVQTLAYIKECQDAPTLIVCPSVVVLKWMDECKKWCPEFSVDVVLRGKDKIPTTDIVIMSYDIMVSQFENLKEIKWRIFVLDEMHKIKSSKAIRSKVAKSLGRKIPHIIGLSGTPMLNRPIELWNILNLLDPVAFGNWYQFANRYCFDPLVGYRGAANLAELKERLSGVMIRRTKDEVLKQLPELRRVRIPVDIDKSLYKKVYVKNPAAIRSIVGDDWKGYIANDLDWLSVVRRSLGLAKTEMGIQIATEFLEDNPDEKLVMYFVHKENVRHTEEALLKYGVEIITGDVSTTERKSRVDRWQNSTKYRVMLITSAGGEGINLFSLCEQGASRILFVEREWNPAMEEQAEGRLHRIGQKNAVDAMYLIADGTIDNDIDSLIESKRSIIHSAVGSPAVLTIEKELLERLRA